ncbi:hypothetical protein [Haliscomenobacter sp.]|uniref:hypothetical protein n=1 Tax=Haliscomenobacter sp. TaxID=2717303 RepID=UPI003364CBB3
MKYGLYLVLFCVLISSSLWAQDASPAKKGTKDMVVLKSGEKIQGEILKYEQNKELVLRTTEGIEMAIPAEKVDKFFSGTRASLVKRLSMPQKPFLKAGSFYNNFALFVPFGAETIANSHTGFGFEYSAGVQLNSRLGVGLGTGINLMIGADRLVPVVAELRYYNNAARRHRAYVLLDGGYSIGWAADNTNDAYSVNGGFRIHPALGVVWNKAGNTHFSTELGFLHQRASIKEDYWETITWIKENKYQMNRWLFKIGLIF